MIEVHRPTVVPPVLLTQGVDEHRRLCRAYQRTSAKYDNGQKVFVFDSKIYGHDEVKTALRAAQHDKRPSGRSASRASLCKGSAGSASTCSRRTSSSPTCVRMV